MHKSVKSLFREHHHPYTNLTNLIQGSSSGMHEAVSLFLRSIFFPYPWWCLAPAQPPTQESQDTSHHPEARDEERERHTEYLWVDKEQKRMYLCCNCGWWGSQNPPRLFWFLGTSGNILARLMALISTEGFSSFWFPAWNPPLSNTCIRIFIPKLGVQTERSVEETISPPKISVTDDKKRAQEFWSFENCTAFLACSSNPWPGNEGQRLRASGEMGARFRIAVAADDAAVTTLLLSTNYTNCLLLLLLQ